jgi:hypothetical protein
MLLGQRDQLIESSPWHSLIVPTSRASVNIFPLWNYIDRMYKPTRSDDSL